MFWGWSTAAGGALTAGRLERLGAAAAVASERRVWRAKVFVRRRRLSRWSSESCGWSWSSPVLGWSLERRRGCEVLFRGAGRRSVLVVVASGVFVRLGVFSDTAGILLREFCSELAGELHSELRNTTVFVGVISSYLRVSIVSKVMTISLSVVDWLRTR